MMKRLAIAALLSLLSSAALAQNPGIIYRGANPAANDCVKFVNRNLVTTTGAPCSTGATFANPTAQVGLTAVNGIATTAMRSDAAPALDQTAAYAFTGLGATNLLSTSTLSWNNDAILLRDAANVIAQRNGANLQTFRVYGSFTNSANYERAYITDNGVGTITIGGEGAGTGAGVTVVISTDTNSNVSIKSGPTILAHFNGATSISQLRVPNTAQIGFTTGVATNALQTILTSPAAATIQLGAAATDTTGVSQTLQAQGVTVGGTANQRGGNATFRPGISKGNVTSTLNLNTYAIGASGSVLQTELNTIALTNGLVQFPQYGAGVIQADSGGNLSSTTSPTLASLTTTGAAVFKGTPPTLSGTCTTGIQTGGNTAGTFVATCLSQTVILTFATTAPTGWTCNAHDISTPADVMNQTASTQTTATLTGTTVASDVVGFSCVAY